MAVTGHAGSQAPQSMHSSGWIYSIVADSNSASSFFGWMQSTGHASTHAVSFVPTQGSQMMYAIESPWDWLMPVIEIKQKIIHSADVKSTARGGRRQHSLQNLSGWGSRQIGHEFEILGHFIVCQIRTAEAAEFFLVHCHYFAHDNERFRHLASDFIPDANDSDFLDLRMLR